MIFVNRFLVFVGILLVFSLCTGVVSAADWTVNPGDSIQAAVNGAGDNDTVVVCDDNGTAYTYTENVVINKKLTVTAASGANVTVQAFDTSFPVFDIENNCNGSVIQNFTIMGATGSVGIYLENSDSITISGNTIINNFWGIYLKNSHKNTISQNHLSYNSYGFYFESSGNNTISGNELATNYNGMWLQYSGSNTLTGNTLANHYTYALVLDHSDSNTISWNNIINNYSCRGIWLQNSANNTLNDNQLTSNYVGIWLDYSPSNTISGNNGTNNDYGLYIYQSGDNTIHENSFADNYVCGLVLDYSDNNTCRGNNLTSNDYGGIWLDNAGNNTLTENNLTGSHFGMCLNSSPNNIISGNNGSSNDYGLYLDYSDNNQIVDNNLTLNGVGLEAHYSNNGTITRNSFIDNNGSGIIFYYSSGNINFNRIFGNGLEYEGYGLYNDGSETVDATGNWWGSDDPVVSLTGPSDIGVAGGTVLYDPWFGADIAFTVEWIKTASEVVKTYIETNHQLPCGVEISGIEVNMAQFLKLSTQAVLNINDELNNTIILGDFQDAASPLENITLGLVFDAEFVDLAADIKNSMNSNGYAPNYVADTSLGDFMGFESLVYMYSQILTSYNCTEGALPDSVSVVPWIAVSNPDKVYNFRTQEFFTTIQAAIDDADTQNNDTITLGDGTFTENLDVDKRLKITSLSGNTTVNAADMDLPVFTIQLGGSGSIIQNLIIIGATGNAGIFINNSNNNTIFQNNLTSNLNGVYVDNSSGNEVSGNTISCNINNGIFIDTSSDTTLAYNTVKNNSNHGIKVNSSLNNTIYSNSISNNSLDGICLYNSSAGIYLNRIAGNGRYGLYNEGSGTVNATNNWWGSNNQTEVLASVQGTMDITQWIVLSVTSSRDQSVTESASYIITADLTHNNQGEDTSSGDTVPEGIPVDFNTTFGTIITPASTRNGKAVSRLNSTSSGTANVTVSLDNQSITKTVIVSMVGVLNSRTNESFNSIQAAIDDTDTLNGDIILLGDGTYTENIVVNKTVTIKPVLGENVTVNAADTEKSVFLITSGGSGSTIQGLNIGGADNANGIAFSSANNCNISGNRVTGNDKGIYFYLSSNNTISGNVVRDNYYGMALYNSTGNSVSLNNLTDNYYGIYFENSNSTVLSGNNVTDNWDGVHLYNSTGNNLTENTVKGNWIGVYLFKSNNTTLEGNIVVDNGCGICYYDSGNSTVSGNSISDNWVTDTAWIDSSEMVVATTIYTCGPAALATVMKNLGVNATEDELATLAGTDETGTTMYGLKQAALSKGLNAAGYRLGVDQLQTDYIVVLKINGNYHYNIIRNITSTMVYLIDPNFGFVEMNRTRFSELFISNLTDSTGFVLIVANGTIEVNGTLLTDEEMQNIKAMAYTTKFKYVWVDGYWYSTKEWVNTSHYGWKLRWVWVSGYWAHWGPLSWYVWGHYELRWVRVWVKSGYWKTVWHYKKGYWKKITYKVQYTPLTNREMLFNNKQPYLNKNQQQIVVGVVKIAGGGLLVAGGTAFSPEGFGFLMGYGGAHLIQEGITDVASGFR